MTEKVLCDLLDMASGSNYSPPEEVQKFIDDEHAETTRDIKYAGLYGGRFLAITTDELTRDANGPALNQLGEERILALLEMLNRAGYKSQLDSHLKRMSEIERLTAIKAGAVKLKGGTFEFRGEFRKRKLVDSLVAVLEQELEQDETWFEEFDREVMLVHLRMAQMLGDCDLTLYQRYYFHLALQRLLQRCQSANEKLAELFEFIAKKDGELNKQQFEEVISALADIHSGIRSGLEQVRALLVPPLQNINDGQRLRDYLLDAEFIPMLPEKTKTIDGDWTAALFAQCSGIEEKARRLYFKSMGAILIQQESIAADWEMSRVNPIGAANSSPAKACTPLR
jgi:hypothetical protein